jgi:hypothetical protein
LFFLVIKDLPPQLHIVTEIFIRKCYPELLILICKHIDELLNDVETDIPIRVTGTPGMGKSMFLGYVWYYLLKAKCDVVAKVGQNIIRSQKGSETYDVIRAEDHLDLCTNRNIIFLVDSQGIEPKAVGITVFFVSPAHEGPRSYPRTNWLNLFMPPWRKEELVNCIKKIYPHCEKEFESNFKKWGGSIRSLTKSKVEKSRNMLLEEFLSDQCLVDVVNMQEGVSGILRSEVKRFQWLIHIIPTINEDGTNNYEDNPTLSFPSLYIGSKVAQRIRDLRFDWKKLGHPRLLGNAYESHTLDTLFKVSEADHLSVRATDIRSKAEVFIEAVKKHHVFSSKAVINNFEKNTLYIPIEPNRPGLDLIMPPWAFQITIAKSHTAKRLDETFQQFPTVKSWKLCFVLPPAIINEFTAPKVALYPSVVGTYKLAFDFGS